MERIQRRFEKESPGPGPLRHYLIVAPHNTLAEHGNRDFDSSRHLPPEIPPVEEAVSFGGGAFTAPESSVENDRPQQSWCSVFFGAESTFERFGSIAEDAGRLIGDLARMKLPIVSERVILSGLPYNARNMEGGMIFGKAACSQKAVDRWMLMVHELGWNSVRGSPLALARHVWAGTGVMAYWSDDDLEELLQAWPGGALYSTRLRDENPIPPMRFYSVIEQDVFAASAAAIDRLLEIVSDSGVTPGADSVPVVEPKTVPAKRILTDGQRAVWEALHGQALIAKQLAKKLDTSEDVIRRHVKELRRSGYAVETRRGLGYYRLDAPP